eukprot:1061941-Rhodomonas_salina.2
MAARNANTELITTLRLELRLLSAKSAPFIEIDVLCFFVAIRSDELEKRAKAKGDREGEGAKEEEREVVKEGGREEGGMAKQAGDPAMIWSSILFS